MKLVYKILTQPQWYELQQTGQFGGAPVDFADGYIHLSSADQVRGTLAKHFAGQNDLMIVGVDVEKLGEALRWEKSRDDALFPHYYGLLTMDQVATHQTVNEFFGAQPKLSDPLG